jgi:two-component system nitrogen regulation response regulator GlnG
VVEAELADIDTVKTAATAVDIDNLEEAVDAYMENYFASYGGELPPVNLYSRVLRELEKPLIVHTLAATRGNQIKASELLGLNRNTLRKKIKELDIQVTRGVK